MSDEHPPLLHAERSRRATRILAIRQLLVEKDVVTTDELDDIIVRARARTPADGAKVVARAWLDEEFRERLLTDARAAVGDLGYQLSHDTELAVVENTADVHHLVVCTLCSCYPTSLLGPPPDWYKSFAYRQRAVIEPRAVLREFGLELADGVRVRVVDSTADVRYLVLPRRPAGTQGLGEDALAELVTRDSMIGVAEARSRDRV
ncbi:MAG: nitrile hydratase subunit alpha [Gammaproteobacteria bacterium]|nr:nitrile hydratase subunit alpha [Gammaproteobacteria bacterium]